MAISPRLSGLFADRYLIERELGHGATAVVYLAHDQKQDREIALKVLSKDLAHSLGPQRFLREIHVTSRLHHPHILPIFDSGEWNGLLYYVMPCVRGESLREKLDRESQLPIEECVRISCEVAGALGHAHAQGVVHRDVKPENIMLSDGHALLADFGIARALDVHTGERLTSSGLIVGTSAYMSPEQASGEENIDARSDVYSLACVLYEMIAGVQAFTGPNTQSVIAQRFKHTPRPVSTYRPQVPEYLERALEKALTIAPADRYASVKKFAADLPEVASAEMDRRRSPIRRAIYGRQKAFGFAAAALAALSAAFVAVNPPGNWRSPFAGRQLDSTRFIVVPYASRGHSEIGEKDLAAASRLYGELRKWSGLTVVDPDKAKEAVSASGNIDDVAAMELAKRNRAGRVIRVNSDGDAALYDAATGESITQLTSSELRGTPDTASAAILNLLGGRGRPASAAGGDGLTNSLPAWRAYNDGHRFLAKGDVAGATRSFTLAARLDPAFGPSHLWAAQVREWTSPADSLAWMEEARGAAGGVQRFSPRDRSLAAGLNALGNRDYPAACGQYKDLLARDSSDFAGWLGFGECQRLDRRVVPSSSSPSGFRFRTSFHAAGAAYLRAVRANPAAFDLIGYARMREIKAIETSKLRSGRDSSNQAYAARADLVGDTIAYVPYPIARLGSITTTASTRAALERNVADLLAFATNWVRAASNSAQGYEALAAALEARGEIDRGANGSISASTALSNALRLTADRTQRVRIIASEIRLRIKRSDFAGARTLSDSLLRAETNYVEAVSDELLGPALYTGRLAIAANAAVATTTVPGIVGGVRIPAQVQEAFSVLFVHAAVGDCSPSLARLRMDLDQRMTSYLSNEERTRVRPILLSRLLSLLAPCTHGQSALEIEKPDRLQQMQQSFARRDFARVRMIFDSLEKGRQYSRPADLSTDYTFQEAWLRAAIGDTAGAIRQLDQTLDALPTLSARTMGEPGAGAALARALMLRADLASSKGDAATARRYAGAVAALWAEADPELQPTVARMKRLAGLTK